MAFATTARKVALHPEGVDLNSEGVVQNTDGTMSPSTRRAWIEIRPWLTSTMATWVALHPEGVDRNDGDVLDEAISKSRPPPGGRG